MKSFQGRLLGDPKVTEQTHPKAHHRDLYSSAKLSTENYLTALGREGREGRELGRGVKTMANLQGQPNVLATLPGDCVITKGFKLNFHSCH